MDIFELIRQGLGIYGEYKGLEAEAIRLGIITPAVAPAPTVVTPTPSPIAEFFKNNWIYLVGGGVAVGGAVLYLRRRKR